MGDQIFRFSILRSPEAADDNSSTIFVPGNREPVDDSLAPIAEDIAAWVRQHSPTDSATVKNLIEDLGLRNIDQSRDRFIGTVNFANNQFVGAFRTFARRMNSAERQDFIAAGDTLIAANLLTTLGSFDLSDNVADVVKKYDIQIDPVGIFGPPAWVPMKSLVRAPSICDHFVVREELVGYEMGQIEDIKNYLRGEHKNHSLRYLTVSEEEFVSETEKESVRTTETATQQRSSMKAAAQATAMSTMGLDARVKTEGQYGPTKVNTDVGFQYSNSSTESSQTASEFSSDVLQRSVEEVRERELQRTTRRKRTELEENRQHEVNNIEKPDHLVGIYRWVDSVWRATTYKVGKRLVLEFLIPEPGQALLKARKLPPESEVGPAPALLPDNLFDTLTEAQASELAIKYGVEGVTSAPLPFIVTGVPFGTTEYKDSDGPRVTAMVVKDVKIPEGYVGKTVFVAVTAMSREDTDVVSNVVIDVAGAKPLTFLDNPTSPANPAIFGPGPGHPNTDLTTIAMRAVSEFGPGATVPVTIYAEDTRGLAGYVEVHCVASSKAVNTWKLDTVQKLTAGYFARLSEWEAKKQVEDFTAVAPAPRIDIEALCRHAGISTMLGTWPSTAGRSGPDGWPEPAALAGKTGLLVEFMEQAFEWHNLQYVAYPYYWADRRNWMSLLGVDDPDPKAREFLRSGAVRMVVPVTPDMTPAVLFFLGTGLPWFGGPAPIPGEVGYKAIADEIKESRQKKGADEEVVGVFDYRLPTSLTILQETGELAPIPPLPPFP